MEANRARTLWKFTVYLSLQVRSEGLLVAVTIAYDKWPCHAAPVKTQLLWEFCKKSRLGLDLVK